MNTLQSYIGQELPGKISRINYRTPNMLKEKNDKSNIDLSTVINIDI